MMSDAERPLSVLVNATTLIKGGAVQVAASFINEAMRDATPEIKWFMVVSPQVAAEVHDKSAIVEVFEESPAKSKAARQQLLDAEQASMADIVFTVFGPAYVKFTEPHLSGIADGWVTHSGWQAFRALGNPVRMLKSLMLVTYKAWWMRLADFWVVEAEAARQGMKRRLGINPDKVAVVSNTCARAFIEEPREAARLPQTGETLRLLYLSSFYKHKNVGIIPKVAAALKQLRPELQFEFVLTLPENEGDWSRIKSAADSLGVGANLTNAGPIAAADAPALYKRCHIAFMPSLLETFSANYPEAMATGRPLVASDLGFAHNCCGDAASYFEAESPQAAAEQIVALIEDEARWNAQIEAGFARLAELPDAHTRYSEYTKLILQLGRESSTEVSV